MSGIYLQGMEMPKKGHTVTLTIMGGGEAVVQYYDCKPQLTVPIVYKAIPVPPHGRTIDADAFKKRMMQGAIDAREDALTDEIWLRVLDAAKNLCLDVDEQPTIIPGEEQD